MNDQVNNGLQRLTDILPLLAGLQALSPTDQALYCKLLHSYAERGSTLTRDEVAALVDDADSALANVVASKLIVLDDNGNPAGAYPFTSQQREFKVHINGVTAHCMCALDALSVSCMFETPTAIDSECRVTKAPIHIEQNQVHFTGGATSAWFGIDWGAAASEISCAESLCMEMLFLAGAETAASWQAESSDTREIYDLQSAVEFAAAFFVPQAKHCRENAA